MKKLFLVVCAALVFSAPVAHATVPDSFAPVVEPLMPAVVNISITQKVMAQNGPQLNLQGLPDDPAFRELFKQFNQQFGGGQQQREVNSLGSGFVIDADGYIVTNNHVIANAAEVTVVFSDNTRLPATIVGRDSKIDLALLKVKPTKKLVAVPFGDSDALRVGDWLIAIGNPFGLGGSVSAGIVSARGRNINAGPFDDFIQTDAAINRGNSGGPLFNTKGEVVGINSAIFSPTGANIGIGFAIPSSLAEPIIKQLRQTGRAQRAWLGVKIQQVSEPIADSLGLPSPRGALVLDISPQSPADGSGIVIGDVITKFDGREVKEMHELPRLVADTKIGKKVEVEVVRKGRPEKISMTLTEQPSDGDDAPLPMKESKAKPRNNILGMALAEITDAVRAQFNLPKTARGLIVVQIITDGEAAKQGIRPGDIILDVNQTAVRTVDDVNATLVAAKKAGRSFALMRIQRGENVQFITMPVK
jgi:serine protease Do